MTRPRVSLLSLLLLTALAAVSAALVAVWQEVGPLREEVRRLRDETGQLTIDDPDLAYTIRIPTEQDQPRKYRVYLPPGRDYAFRYQANEVPENGVPSDSENSSPIPAGEWIVAIEVERMKHAQTGEPIDYLDARFSYESATDGNRASSFVVTIGERDNDWINNENGSPAYGWEEPSRETRTHNPSEPLVVYRGRAQKHIVLTRSADGRPSSWTHEPIDGPCDGILLWIEPIE